MLPAINLDHHAPLETYEICDEPARRHLSAKLEICKSSIAQRKPKFAFCIGHIFS
jgi:hypothetical protein